MEEILNFFPEELKQKLKLNLIQNIEELRIRSRKASYFKK